MSIAALLALIDSGALSGLSRAEAAERAVAAVVASIGGLTVLRGPEPAGEAAAGPWCRVLAGDPTEVEPATLSAVQRHFDLRVELLFQVERRTTAAAAAGTLDALIVEAARLFDADRTLGGVVQDLLIEPRGQRSDESPEGVNESSAAVLPVVLMYSTGRNPEETIA